MRYFILGKGLQIKLQGGNRSLELMGEIVDEGLLQAIELESFQVINEDDENPREDDADQQGQDEDDNPGTGLNKLAWIKLVTIDERFESCGYPDVPVDIQKEGTREGDC
jgi:hypothetical protein